MPSKPSPLPITLQINLTPWDLPHACLVLPHQLQFWSTTCAESLLLWDLDPGPKIQTESGQKQWQACMSLLPVFQAALQADWPALVQKNLDLRGPEADTALRALGQRYFVPHAVLEKQPVPPMPRKDFRGGPFAAYFMGLEWAQHDLVLHLDGDMLFGGAASTWLISALKILAEEPDCLCVAPPGGPPANPHVGRQQKQTIFTSRCFLLRRADLFGNLTYAQRLPETFSEPGWLAPYAELVEVILTQYMHSQGLFRLDFSPVSAPIWSLHPPTQFDPRYLPLLPQLINQMHSHDWPTAQMGVYDLLPSSLDWLAEK